ncbi:hypothetical protein OUZ56_011556 [Daphnia magna]|uniref:Alpha 1,4-glycosyltransferase domain-containing protein n=1 Tax=Daphnia magna TaxID=35525 RepID=A0ABQ9Z0I1_9CRUS|nr:hypothetical protein OUZ56_011556 [Daphnia magna]
MVSRRKLFREVFLTLYLLFFIHCLLGFSSSKFKKQSKHVFCIGNQVVVTSPAAYGRLMMPNILPTKWEAYDWKTQGERNLRIFFHETSGKNKLSLIQCCAVESAAKHNPNRLVQLFLRPLENCSGSFKMPLKSASFYNPAWLEVISEYPNVSPILINEENYFSETPLEEWYRKKEWKNSPYMTEHYSDYIRVLSLYKEGGLYLDIDILTLRPYHGDMFRNFLVYGSSRMDHISNGAMQLEPGHWLSKEILHLLAKEYDPNSYIYHGPDVVGEVMKRVCGVAAGSPESNQCSDVQILPDKLFYPIPSITSNLLFEDKISETNMETLAKINGSFGLHLWNSLSKLQNPLNIHSNQVIAILARKNCPLTISRATDFESL